MPFQFNSTPIDGLIVANPRVFGDHRGFFVETYKKSDFVSGGIPEDFIQDNHSFSCQGVLRGLHFQSPPHAQGKLVQVIVGAVWDVAVDLRPDSSTYLKWYGIELTEENHLMMYIPPGFAHGYYTLVDDTHFLYKCTTEYAPKADGGVRWDDPDIGIVWPIPQGESPLVSEKDAALSFLKDLQ